MTETFGAAGYLLVGVIFLVGETVEGTIGLLTATLGLHPAMALHLSLPPQ